MGDFDTLEQRVAALEDKVFNKKAVTGVRVKPVVTQEVQRAMLDMTRAYIATAAPSLKWQADAYVYHGTWFYLQAQPLIAMIVDSLGIEPTAELLGAQIKSLRASGVPRRAWGWPVEEYKDVLKPRPGKPDPKSRELPGGWVTIPEFARRANLAEYAVRTMVQRGELVVMYWLDDDKGGQMTTLEIEEHARKYLNIADIPRTQELRRPSGRPSIPVEGPIPPAWHEEGKEGVGDGQNH